MVHRATRRVRLGLPVHLRDHSLSSERPGGNIEKLVARAHERFDANDRLTDESTIDVLRGLLERFENWIRLEKRVARTRREH